MCWFWNLLRSMQKFDGENDSDDQMSAEGGDEINNSDVEFIDNEQNTRD